MLIELDFKSLFEEESVIPVSLYSQLASAGNLSKLNKKDTQCLVVLHIH